MLADNRQYRSVHTGKNAAPAKQQQVEKDAGIHGMRQQDSAGQAAQAAKHQQPVAVEPVRQPSHGISQGNPPDADNGQHDRGLGRVHSAAYAVHGQQRIPRRLLEGEQQDRGCQGRRHPQEAEDIERRLIMGGQTVRAGPEQGQCGHGNETRPHQERRPALYAHRRDRQRPHGYGRGKQAVIHAHQAAPVGVIDDFIDPGFAGHQQAVGRRPQEDAQYKPGIQVVETGKLQQYYQVHRQHQRQETLHAQLFHQHQDERGGKEYACGRHGGIQPDYCAVESPVFQDQGQQGPGQAQGKAVHGHTGKDCKQGFVLILQVSPGTDLQSVPFSPLSRIIRMCLMPVPGYVHAPAEPDPVMLQYVIKEPLQRGRPARPADNAAVQSDGHHLRRRLPFPVEQVEGILQVGEKLLPAIESLAGSETHVVGVQGIRDYQVRLAVHHFPVGQIVRVGIRVIQEPAVFDDQAAGIRAVTARVPAQRRAAGQSGDRLHRQSQVGPFGLLVHKLVIDPAPAVARYLVTVLQHGAHGAGITLQRHGGAEHGDLDAPLTEDAQQAPEPGPAAVLVQGFHALVAHAGVRLSADDLRQKSLRRGIPVQYGIFRAFLVIEHDLQGETRARRPLRIGRICPVAD